MVPATLLLIRFVLAGNVYRALCADNSRELGGRFPHPEPIGIKMHCPFKASRGSSLNDLDFNSFVFDDLLLREYCVEFRYPA
jgi:hypothetical protein